MALNDRIDSDSDTSPGSNRSFGLVFATVFALIGGVQLWHDGSWGWGLLAVAFGFLSIALLAPKMLQPLNHLWFRFGLLLHRITNPVIMGLLFYGSLLPIGLIMRALGKRPLNLKFDKAARSYWIDRHPPGPDPGSFRRQF